MAVGIEVAEWAFNDEAVLTDLFGDIGVELVKAGIATTVGYAAGVFAGTLITAAAAPVAAGAIFVFIVGYGLNAIDNHYGIKTRSKLACAMPLPTSKTSKRTSRKLTWMK